MARGKGKTKTQRSGKRKLSETATENEKTTQNHDAKKVALSKDCKLKEEFGDILSEKYDVKFSDDFFRFFDFCQTSQCKVLDILELQFCGPYDFLNGKIDKNTNLSKIDLHMHGRFYYDIPEVMTVLFNESGFHIAYFRDEPSDDQQFIVSNDPKHGGEYQICGDNLFAAVYQYCKKQVKGNSSNETSKLMKEIECVSKEFGLSLESNSALIKARNKRVVSKCFHGAGLVVNIDATGVGYRELPLTNRELKKLLSNVKNADSEDKRNEYLDEIQETITLVQFANDECDYGMGYELGIDLFIFGGDVFHGMVSHLLPLAYQFLRRNLFEEILEKHLELRKNDYKPINMLEQK